VRRALLILVLACAHAQPTGAPLPGLTVRTLSGEQVRLDQLRGPALVDLWATWCVPCAHALPFYQRLAEQTGLRVVAISIDAEDEPVRDWVAKHQPPFQILRDPDGEVAEQLGMKLMPTSFLIDRNGVVRARHDGFRDEDEPLIEREVRALLAGQ
jgi:thiol-disulfide isomerase/thioredoxin